MQRFQTMLFALACVALIAPQAQADELTEEEKEMVRKFERHPKLGKSRGIQLIPSDGDEVASNGKEYKQIEPADTVTRPIVFDVDSWILKPDQAKTLDSLCNVIKHMEQDTFQIVGHTDASGPDTYNEWLSLQRAQAVRSHLVDNCGIPDERLSSMGVGESYLLRPDDPLAADNRRVEFQRAN